MFFHHKKLMYTVRVRESNPQLASLMLEQFGGPQGELAAAMRYFTQGLGECDPGRKDLLMDIATEEISHLEIIGTIIAMLNRGPKAIQSEGLPKPRTCGCWAEQHQPYRADPVRWRPALVNSSGVPWTAAYIDSIGEPTADLRSNIAAEARAKLVYERLITVTDDPGIKDALRFLMTREIAHRSPSKRHCTASSPTSRRASSRVTPPLPTCTWTCRRATAPMTCWAAGTAASCGSGSATARPRPLWTAVTAAPRWAWTREQAAVQAMTLRTLSDPEARPTTGAELGAGPGAGALDLPPREP
jgi:Mn-containing catalase